MSTIKVQNIQHTGSSTNAIALASDGTATANLTNRQGKNLVVNGACLIAQRGTSSTSSSYQTVDGFEMHYAGTDEAPTQAQVDVASGTTPYTLGFRKAFSITNGNQTVGAGAGDYIWIQTKLEAQDIANSGWNYLSSSSNITLSFWIKSSVAQDFKGYLRSRDSTNYMYPFATGSLSADTWTKVTKTISGNSNLVFNNDNEEGLQINILAFMGTNTTSNSVTENAWATYSSSARIKDNTSTWYTTNDATLEITGLQLEVSDHATSFQHLSFHENYLRCARYYIQMNRLPVMSNRAAGHCSCTTRFNPVPMRAIPSISIAGTLSFNSFFYGQAIPTTTTTPNFQANGDSGQPYGGDNMILNFSGFSTSGFPTNEMGEVYGTTISISAEL